MCVKSSPCSTSSTRPNTRSMGRRTVKYSNSATTDSSRRANSSPASRKSIRPKKKPKYLSLRLDISPENSKNMADHRPPSQLNLFPLHPENQVSEEEDMHEVEAELAQENDDQDHEHVSYFLINPDEEYPSTSLTAILTESTTACADGGSPGEESRTYGGYREQDISSSLMRSALRRNRAREDVSEEKWVSYSEVIVEEKEEEVSSCSYFGNLHQRRLSLKLDYQEILDAWCNKGSLFVEAGDSPQTVPEIDDGLLFGHHPDATSALWTVPDIIMSKTNTMEDEVANDIRHEGRRQREASVLRYKEKRQNRLFSKRIRYEVRKLNAEKRPRMKEVKLILNERIRYVGRFVKRDS